MSFWTDVRSAAVPALLQVGVAWATGGTASWAMFGRAAATYYVLGQASRALAKKPDAAQQQAQSRTVTAKEATAPHRIVYGRTRIGGNIVYMEGTNSNKYLHLVITLAAHEIDAVESVYFNDEEVTWATDTGLVNSTNYSGKARIRYKLGTSTQTAFSELVSESNSLWTANHKLQGIACLYVRLEYDQDKYPNGIPNITAVIRGKKVYDPRSDATAYSANPALCLADYLTDSLHGLGAVYADEIDETFLIDAANDCDDDIALDAGGTEKRYEMNGSYESSVTSETVINNITAAMAGKAIWASGKWRIYAGVYKTPTLTFDEGDLRAGLKVQTLVSRRELFNGVKGTFASPDNNWIMSDFPPVLSDTFKAQDNNEEILKNVEFLFTTSSSMAQRLAKIDLLKARQQISLTLPLKLVGFKAQVGDIIQVDNTRFGWSAKKFEVTNSKVVFDDMTIGVDLELREIDDTVFDWNVSEEQVFDPAPNTSLPNAYQVSAPSNLTINGINVLSPDGTTQSGLLVAWDAPTNSFVYQYEVQYIRGASNFDFGLITASATESDNYGLITTSADTSADYGSVSDSTSSAEVEYNTVFVTTPKYVITPVIAGVEYAVRVRSVNVLGVRSSFVTSNEITYGDTSAPNVPSTIVAYGDYKQIVIAWVNPSVSDFDYVEVYRNTTNNSGTAVLAGVLRGSRFVDAPLGTNVTRYYWLKSVDRTGNKSDFSSVVYATTEFVDTDALSAEVMNLFSEAGAYGIEPVATLPTVGDFDGQIKYDTTNNKLWRWDAGTSAWTDDIFSITSGSVDLASFASGIEPVSIVSSLPTVSGYTGAKIVFLTTDNTLYRYTGSAWTSAVDATNISGTLPSSAFSQSLRPVEVVSALPSSGNFQGRTVLLTSDNKLYRHTGSAWTAAVSSSDISGSISDAQIAGLAASKVTGQLSNSQIEAIAAAKITGTITETQITDSAITTAKINAGAITSAKIAAEAVVAESIASGAITSAKIEAGAITTAKIAAGAVTASEIASGSITSTKIAANAVTAEAIAADSITSGKISAGAITSTKIEAGAIGADQIAANAITSGKISAGAITATAISTDAIESDKIKAGAIQTDKIAANAITGGLIAASGVITLSAQIDDGLITNAKIANAAITSAKIGDAEVDTLQIKGNAVTVPVSTSATSNVTLNTSTWVDLLTAAIDAGSGNSVAITASASTNNTTGFPYFYLRIMAPDGTVTGSSFCASSGCIVAKFTQVGTYKFQALGAQSSTMPISTRGMILMGVKR